jgi:hypothetical protein
MTDFFIAYKGTLYFVTCDLSNPHKYYVTKLYFSQYKPQYLKEVGPLECDSGVLTQVLSKTSVKLCLFEQSNKSIVQKKNTS